MNDDRTKGPKAQVTRRQAVGVLGAAAAAIPAVAAAAGPNATALEPTGHPASLLYPHESPTRATRDLSGLWRFQLDPKDEGEAAHWFETGLPASRAIPVPCSWNDLFDDARNYFGTAWYETEFQLDPGWAGKRVHLRFGSAVYHARVWLNGHFLGEHMGGHLPFAFEVTHLAHDGQPNRLVVSVENRLELDRVPAIPDPRTSHPQIAQFPQTTYDFFPYSGLHRPVLLFATPDVHLQDLTVVTGLNGAAGTVDVALKVSGGWTGTARLILAGGKADAVVAISVKGGEGHGRITLPAVRPWSPEDPFLYRLTVQLGDRGDLYALKVGVRTVEVHGSEIRLNGKPVFLTGFGKHEDFPLHGRGLDLAALVRDFELLKWIGANSFRTSHYPYSEEAMMLADEYGFMVIGEGPGVSLVFMDPPAVIEARYKQLSGAISELMARDKNHPSVIMWSLANEPIPKPFNSTSDPSTGAEQTGTDFFRRLFAHARSLDSTRPIALVSVQGGPPDWVGFGDVICTNSYNGWYAVSGRPEDAIRTLQAEIAALRARHGDKPVIFTEFGADAVAGMHAQPAEMWSEEYQAELIEAYWHELRRHPYVVGAHPWAFADFKTQQSIMRVGAMNHKGVFTRDRKPKLAATKLRALWTAKA